MPFWGRSRVEIVEGKGGSLGVNVGHPIVQVTDGHFGVVILCR